MSNIVFNEVVAASYDADSADMFDPRLRSETVDFLAELARGAGALEFAIETGRVALPLSQRGIAVPSL